MNRMKFDPNMIKKFGSAGEKGEAEQKKDDVQEEFVHECTVGDCGLVISDWRFATGDWRLWATTVLVKFGASSRVF